MIYRIGILYVILFIFVTTMSASGAETYFSALARAQKENKHILLYFFSNGCTYCDKMDREVLADRQIQAELREGFVFVRIDVDRDSKLADKYDVRLYPTTWLLDSTGHRIAQAPGYLSKSYFTRMLVYLKGEHYKTTSLPDFLARKQSP
jgi:thioredoxin-related protein